MFKLKDMAFFNRGQKIKAYGLNISREAKQEIDTIVEELRESAPYLSNVSLVFKPAIHQVKAELSIKAIGISFYATRLSDTPLGALSLASEDISKQLEEWKRNRFSNLNINRGEMA